MDACFVLWERASPVLVGSVIRIMTGGTPGFPIHLRDILGGHDMD
jgi:hypothetical protein